MAEKRQKRRGHDEGTIYQRRDGRWVAEITLEDGNRKPFYGKTRKEVADKLNTALQEQKQGTRHLLLSTCWQCFTKPLDGGCRVVFFVIQSLSISLSRRLARTSQRVGSTGKYYTNDEHK